VVDHVVFEKNGRVQLPKKSETAIVVLVVVGFGRVIPRSNEELGVRPDVEKF